MNFFQETYVTGREDLYLSPYMQFFTEMPISCIQYFTRRYFGENELDIIETRCLTCEFTCSPKMIKDNVATLRHKICQYPQKFHQNWMPSCSLNSCEVQSMYCTTLSLFGRLQGMVTCQFNAGGYLTSYVRIPHGAGSI